MVSVRHMPQKILPDFHPYICCSRIFTLHLCHHLWVYEAQATHIRPLISPYLSLLEPDGGSRTEKAGTASVTSLPKPESISPLWFRAVGERPGISPGAGDLWNLCI